MRGGIVRVLVDAEHDGHVRTFGRRGDDDLLRAGGQMLRGALAVGEDAGAFEHHIDAEVLPRQLRRILDRQHLELVAVHGDAVRRRLDVGVEVTEHRVVLEKVRERRGIGEIVHRHEIKVLVPEGGAHDVASNAPEPIDPHLHGHRVPPHALSAVQPNFDCSALNAFQP
jgi:hypothetical protein